MRCLAELNYREPAKRSLLVPRNDAFIGLSEFLAVAKFRSFRKAAIELGVTPGAVSQAIQALESRLRQPLFHRTTRWVALTEAGERLLGRVGPAAGVITESLDDLLQRGAQPSGTLRLLVQRSALSQVIEPLVPSFRREYPEVKLEIAVEADHSPLVGAGYDAGVRIGEYIDRDMVAVRISRLFRWLVFGAPSYLKVRGRPRVPEDLSRHECIRYRRPEIGDVYRWEFERNGQAVVIDPPGSVLVNDSGLARGLGRQGLGLFYSASINVAADVEQGTLEPLLEKFSPAQEGIFIYYPRASRNQPKLRAFVELCTRGI
jgi:DNA-binding transcriptional LysR family regulator